MTEDVCPVIAAIQEIRGGGTYVDDMEDSSDRVVKLGGAQGTEYVMNDVAFYMMTRRLELARFELSKPTLMACKAKYKKMFGDISGISYAALRIHIIDKALTKSRYMHSQFTRLVDLIGNIEELIISVTDTIAGNQSPHNTINTSLPSIIFLPRIDQFIVYNTQALEQTVNKIIDYVNKININSIVRTSTPIVLKRIAPVSKFSAVPLIETTYTDEELQAHTVSEYIVGMKKILDQEMHVAAHVNEIEKYHCDVINHTSEIYDTCRALVDGLTEQLRNVTKSIV